MPVVTLDYFNGFRRNTFVNSGTPNNSFETGDTVNTFGMSGTTIYRSLLWFDVGAIPNGAIINSAKLHLIRHSSSGSNRNFEIRALASGMPAPGSVTWNTQPPMTGVSSIGSFDPNSSTELEMKSVVQQWVNSGIENFGFVITNEGEANNTGIYSYYSSNYSVVSNRPKLVIDYSLPSVRKDAYLVDSTHRTSPAQDTSYLVQLPPGATEGDLVIITLQNNAPSTVVSIPQGWTSMYDYGLGNTYRMSACYKKIGASEPNPTFTTAGVSTWWSTASIYRNVKSVLSTQATRQDSTTPFFYPPNVTVAKPNTLAVSINNLAMNTTVVTLPKGFVSSFSNGSTNSTIQSSRRYMHIDKDINGLNEVYTHFGNSSVGVSSITMLEPIDNVPPTPPTNVCMDKREYTVGDTITVNFDPGTDPEGGALKYRIQQYDPDQQKWATFADTSANPATITCHTMVDTNVSKVRVAAVDSGGAVSSYSESATFTVKQKTGQIVAPVKVIGGSYTIGDRSAVVRFANGWLGTVLRNQAGTGLMVFLSKDNGKEFTPYGSIAASALKGYAVEAYGNMLYVMFVPGSTDIGLHALDVTKLNGSSITGYTTVASGKYADVHSMDLVRDTTSPKLRMIASAKFANNQASWNLDRMDANLNSDGTISGVVDVVRVTNNNVSNVNYTNPCIDMSNDGYEYSTHVYQNGTTYSAEVFRRNPGSMTWAQSYIRNNSSSVPTNPMIRISPNGTANLSFIGILNGVTKAMFNRSLNHKDTWGSEVDLGVASKASIAVAPDNNVHILIENNGVTFNTYSSDGFVTFPSSTSRPGLNAVTFKDKSFKTKFTVSPTVIRVNEVGGAGVDVRYFGSIDVGKPPVVTLSSPADNMELMEGTSYQFVGEVYSEMAGAVVVVNANFGSGNVPIGTYVSDGVAPFNFSKTFNYRNKQIFNGNTAVSPILPENTPLFNYTSATDATNNIVSDLVYRYYKVKYNMPPKISGTDQDLGAFMQIPSVNYSATDPEGNTFTFSEYLNGKQIRSFAGVAGQQYTVEISHDAWIRLDLDVQHQIKIVATDSAGISSERIYTFTRTETHIEFMLEYGNPDIKADFTLDGMPLRVLVTLERYLPEGSSIESVKVCNNYLDDVPTWEDCTGAVKGNRGYLFTNKVKTAPEWAINLWVTIDKGTAKERVLVNGYGGAFD